MKPRPPAIVLIEKDVVTLDLYRRELSKSFDVLSFTEIDGVLESIANQDVQAVVIEPEINSGQGWNLIQTIDTNFPGHIIPVIVCSTQDTSTAHPRGSVTKYLIKPVLPKELKEVLIDILKKNKYKIL